MAGRTVRCIQVTLLLAAPGWAELTVEVEGGPLGLVAGAPRILRLADPDAPPRGCWQRWSDYWNPPWSWRVLEGTRLQKGGAGGVIQDLGAGRFRYHPPRTRTSRTLRLQVASRGGPVRTAEVKVQVLPPDALDVPGLGPDPAGLVLGYCPEASHAPLSEPLPFLDVATGLRSRPAARVQERRSNSMSGFGLDWPHRVRRNGVLAGYGLPVRLRWPEEPCAGRLLSWRNGSHGPGADTTRLDVTGQDSQEVTFTAPVSSCTLETLTPCPGDRWNSCLCEEPVLVRGLLPVAGNEVADPVALPQEGQGVSARLVEPCGLALVARGPSDSSPMPDPLLVVAEPRAHALLGIDGETGVRVWLGRPGCPGDQDGGAAKATFNGPTWLACRDYWVWQPEGPVWGADRTGPFFVADSGNHLIRKVDTRGAVTTLAGARRLGPGHRDDADPLLARFNNPQGLALDLDGNLFVADQGNHVIRRIGPDGVTTLAGSPGRPGADDGTGAAARFFRLKGLAMNHGTGNLYVADGHAIRRISPEGQVTTVLGAVDRAGFQDQPSRGQPCLDDPRGLAAGAGHLFIADAGNHAIRALSLEDGSLRTLAGDPGRAAIGWGLLRDGLAEFPAEGYGTLLAPTGLAGDFRRSGEEALFAGTGPCLAQIPAPLRPSGSLPRVRVRALAPLRVGEGYGLAFTVPNERNGSRASSPFDFEFTVEFRDPDGSAVGPPVRGRGGFGALQQVPGRPFTREGTGTVRVRCVTLDGCSGSAERRVPVR